MVSRGSRLLTSRLRSSCAVTAVPLLAVNKCESPEQGLAMAAEFWGLGLGEPYPISAIHGAGTGELLDRALSFLPPKDQEGEQEEPIQLAIIGRPNVEIKPAQCDLWQGPRHRQPDSWHNPRHD